jgi:hypothetical protein
VGTNRPEWEKRREELRKLPPAEREARIKELRQEIQQGRRQFKLLDSDDVESKRKELKERIDAQISALQQLKADGSITEREQRRLEHMQQMSIRLERRELRNTKRTLPPPSTRDAETDVLPPPKAVPNSNPEK